VPGAPPVLDLLMARALAKEPRQRFGSAIELGEAFRSALGLPDSPGWQAQRALAVQACAISQYGISAPGPASVGSDEANRLRTEVMKAYAS